IPTDFSLRDGILSEEMALVKSQKSSLMELHLDDLVTRAIRFGAEETHLRHVVGLGEEVFDRLRAVHRLPDAWKVYLKSALILRNTGEAIGIANHEKHSYYVVKNLELPSVQGWEGEFVARLCLLHADGKVTGKDLGFLGRDARRKDIFRKLCAILRVVDSFDLGPKTSLHLARVTITRREVVLCLRGRAAAGVENLLLDRKKRLFEEVFRRSLRVTRRR
ncbi:MAG: hypothetical protein HUU37_03975, partial [Bdellovibrionales bacterium]|nr:hypothetical protein [Bdellovibrionales bacterium]